MEDSISVENSPHEILTDGYAASGVLILMKKIRYLACFEYGVPLYSGNYRAYVHSKHVYGTIKPRCQCGASTAKGGWHFSYLIFTT